MNAQLAAELHLYICIYKLFIKDMPINCPGALHRLLVKINPDENAVSLLALATENSTFDVWAAQRVSIRREFVLVVLHHILLIGCFWVHEQDQYTSGPHQSRANCALGARRTSVHLVHPTLVLHEH